MNALRRFFQWLMSTGIKGFQEGFDKYPLFWIALPLSLYILFCVPQVSNIWMQFPPFHKAFSLLWSVWLGYLVFVGALAAYYLSSLIVVMRRFPIALVEEWAKYTMARLRARWHQSRRKRWLDPSYWLAEYVAWPAEMAARLLLCLVSYPTDAPAVPVPATGRVRAVWRWVRETATDFFSESTGPRRLGPRMFVTAGLAVLAAAFIFAAGAVGDSSKVYPLGGAACRNMGLLFLLCSVWAVAQLLAGAAQNPLGKRGYTYAVRLRRELRRIHLGRCAMSELGVYQIRVLSWTVTGVLAGEVLWLLASAEMWGGAFSYRLYTTWAVFHLLTLLILVALLIDRWHQQTIWPLRPLVLVALPLAFWLKGGADPVADDEFTRHLSAAAAADWRTAPAPDGEPERIEARNAAWYTHLQQRVDALPEDSPVVLVAASGGGSRAAIFTALALDTLDRTPLDPRQPFDIGSKRTAGLRTWGDNVVLISSVSGGSLATAYHVHRQKPTDVAEPRPYDETARLHHTTETELLVRLRGHLLELIDNLGEAAELFRGLPKARETDLDKLRSEWVAKRTANPEQAPTINRLLSLLWAEAYCRHMLAHHQEGTPDGAQAYEPESEMSHFDWVLRSAAFDAMSTDFMAPIMRGVLTPVLDRGDALGRFWTEHFHWQNCTNFSGYGGPLTRWNYDKRHPAVVFNACDTLLGARLAIGFPPLPHDLWQPPELGKSAKGRPKTFSELNLGRRISLARAVRMSSNFPWGFRVLQFARREGTDLSPVHVLDGGVVDNTGLDTLYELFAALGFYADPERVGHAYHDRAKTLLAALRRRGIVILEIDAGAKPSNQLSGGPLAGLTEPSDALNNATYCNAEQVKKYYVSEIKRILARSLDDPAFGANLPRVSLAEYREDWSRVEGVLHVPFQCNHYDATGQTTSKDVMTAWSLGPRDKAEIVARFLLELCTWDQTTRKRVVETLTKARTRYAELDQLAKAKVRHEQLAGRVKEAENAGKQIAQDVQALRQRLRTIRGNLKDEDLRELRPDVEKQLARLADYQTALAALERELPADDELRGTLDRLRQDGRGLDQQLAAVKDEKAALAMLASELADRLGNSLQKYQQSLSASEAQALLQQAKVRAKTVAAQSQQQVPTNYQQQIYRNTEIDRRLTEKH